MLATSQSTVNSHRRFRGTREAICKNTKGLEGPGMRREPALKQAVLARNPSNISQMKELGIEVKGTPSSEPGRCYKDDLTEVLPAKGGKQQLLAHPRFFCFCKTPQLK